MKVKITEEINVEGFHYLTARMGDLSKWGSQKTFVRIPYKLKSGSLGTKMYCCSKYSALFFLTRKDAMEMRNKYEVTNEIIKFLDINKLVKNDEIELWGVKHHLEYTIIKGIRCITLVRNK